jgi:hypothetical protein
MSLTATIAPGKRTLTTTHSTLSKIINVTTQQHLLRRQPPEVRPWVASQPRRCLTVPDITKIALDTRPALNNSHMIPRAADLTKEVMQLVAATGRVEEFTTRSLAVEAATWCTDSIQAEVPKT